MFKIEKHIVRNEKYVYARKLFHNNEFIGIQIYFVGNTIVSIFEKEEALEIWNFL